jgi:transcriptional regulator with XRE-family HTH domain
VAQSKVDGRTKATLEELGARIRAARQAARLSQAQLAEAIAMNRENYAKIERAEINVTVDTLVRIASGIGLRVEIDLVSQGQPPRGPVEEK